MLLVPGARHMFEEMPARTRLLFCCRVVPWTSSVLLCLSPWSSVAVPDVFPDASVTFPRWSHPDASSPFVTPVPGNDKVDDRMDTTRSSPTSEPVKFFDSSFVTAAFVRAREDQSPTS